MWAFIAKKIQGLLEIDFRDTPTKVLGWKGIFRLFFSKLLQIPLEPDKGVYISNMNPSIDSDYWT